MDERLLTMLWTIGAEIIIIKLDSSRISELKHALNRLTLGMSFSPLFISIVSSTSQLVQGDRTSSKEKYVIT